MDENEGLGFVQYHWRGKPVTKERFEELCRENGIRDIEDTYLTLPKPFNPSGILGAVQGIAMVAGLGGVPIPKDDE